MLPEVAAAVGGDIEVVMDGGIRRGSDVVMALALGAKAVMIGRAYLWGLAANGQAGVENVLDVLRMGIESTMRGIGKGSLDELGPDVGGGHLQSLVIVHDARVGKHCVQPQVGGVGGERAQVVLRTEVSRVVPRHLEV